MGYFLAGGNRNSWVKQVCFIGGYYTVVKHGYYQFKDFCCKKRGQVFIQVIGIFFCNLSILSTSSKIAWFDSTSKHDSLCLSTPAASLLCTKQGNVLRRLWDDGGFDESLDESRGSERLGTLGDHPRRDLDGAPWGPGLGEFCWNMAIVTFTSCSKCHGFFPLSGGRIGSEDWNFMMSVGRLEWVKPCQAIEYLGERLISLELVWDFRMVCNFSKIISQTYKRQNCWVQLCENYWRQVPKLSKEATMYPTHLHTLRDFTLSMAFKRTILCYIFQCKHMSYFMTNIHAYMQTCITCCMIFYGIHMVYNTISDDTYIHIWYIYIIYNI